MTSPTRASVTSHRCNQTMPASGGNQVPPLSCPGGLLWCMEWGPQETSCRFCMNWHLRVVVWCSSHYWAVIDEIQWIHTSPLNPQVDSLKYIFQGPIKRTLWIKHSWLQQSPIGMSHSITQARGGFLSFSMISHFSSLESFPKKIIYLQVFVSGSAFGTISILRRQDSTALNIAKRIRIHRMWLDGIRGYPDKSSFSGVMGQKLDWGGQEE